MKNYCKNLLEKKKVEEKHFCCCIGSLQLKAHSHNLLEMHIIFYSCFSHGGQNDNPKGFHCATETRCVVLLGLEGRQHL